MNGETVCECTHGYAAKNGLCDGEYPGTGWKRKGIYHRMKLPLIFI